MTDLYTTAETAAVLHCSTKHLLYLARRKKIGKHIIGNRYMFSADQIKRYLKSAEVKARPF